MCVDDEDQIIVKAVDCCTAKLYTDRERRRDSTTKNLITKLDQHWRTLAQVLHLHGF